MALATFIGSPRAANSNVALARKSRQSGLLRKTPYGQAAKGGVVFTQNGEGIPVGRASVAGAEEQPEIQTSRSRAGLAIKPPSSGDEEP